MKNTVTLLYLVLLSAFSAQVIAEPAGNRSPLKSLADIDKLAQQLKLDAQNLHDVCTTLQTNTMPNANLPACLIEAAFDEAVSCLDRCKDMLTPEEVERLANSLEASYEALAQEEDASDSLVTIKGTKKLIDVIVHNHLSAGFLTVGGDLTVAGNEIIDGNLTVHGTTVFAGSVVLPSPSVTNSLNLFGAPEQACIIFRNSTGTTEKARICSSPIPGDKGVFVSIDGGTTQNLRIDNAGNAIINGLPIISVKTYGAVGDGVTNDYTAIVAAMNAAVGVGVVFFPPGTYAVGQSLPMYNNLILTGESKTHCTLKALGNFPVISESRTRFTPLLNAGIVNMTIRGGGKDNVNAHGIKLLFTNRVILSDLFLFSCNHGIDLAHSWQMFMTNVHVHGEGTDQSNIGFYFGPLTDPVDENNTVHAVNCVAQAIAQVGFRLINANGSRFINCEAMNGDYGFYLGDPDSAIPQRQVRWLHFANCLGDTNAKSGWLLKKGLAPYMGEMQFANCWSGNSGESNVVIDGCSNMALSNWMISLSAQNGLALINTSSHISVTGCAIHNYNASNGGFAGINIANSNYCSVTGNNTQTNTNMRGIDLNGTSNGNAVVANIVQGSVGNFSSGTNIIANNVAF